MHVIRTEAFLDIPITNSILGSEELKILNAIACIKQVHLGINFDRV